MKLITYLALVIAMTFSAPSLAKGGLRFGDQDSLRLIQSVELKGVDGEELYLGYRTTTKFFIAGVNITDDGYVLAAKNSAEQSYYTLTAEQISKYQSDGFLPNPLPKYNIETMDYLIGYSLWLIILAGLIYYGAKSVFNKRRAQPEEA